MKRFAENWISTEVAQHPGLAWCCGWYAALAVILLAFIPFSSGMFSAVFLLLFAGLHLFACLGLLRGVKPGWHIAAFLAFAMIVTRSVAIACAPGNIARGDMNLFEAAINVLLLVLAALVFSFLRRPEIRRLYDVPESYRDE